MRRAMKPGAPLAKRLRPHIRPQERQDDSDMTPARRAAEALFAPALLHEAASPVPQVIVRRRKVAAQQLAPASQSAEGAPADGTRDPKVYRLQKTIPASEPREAEESTLGQPLTTPPEDGGRRRRVREERIPSTPVVTRLEVGDDTDQAVETSRSVIAAAAQTSCPP
jgi:hypothetical protein